jgi:hypothetical protein
VLPGSATSEPIPHEPIRNQKWHGENRPGANQIVAQYLLAARVQDSIMRSPEWRLLDSAHPHQVTSHSRVRCRE